MIYDILEQKLHDSGLVQIGISLFRNFMPAECNVGAFIRTPLEGVRIDPYLDGWYRPRLQLITRHTDPVEGYRLASGLGKILIVRHIETYPPSAERGAAQLSLFIPETLPIQFPRLSGNGYEWSQHFSTAFSFSDA